VPITSLPVQSISASSTSAPLSSASPKHSFLSRIWGEDGFSFGDILDALNPLQHLPIVSTLYRAFTGDAIAPAPRVLGDTLFGGPIGAVTGVVNAALKYLSGKDAGEHMLALLPLPTRVEGETVMLAFNTPPAPSTATSPIVQRESNPVVSKNARLAQATAQAQFTAALETYSRNSRLLAPGQRQNRFGIRF
jgi:hypothetical protein